LIKAGVHSVTVNHLATFCSPEAQQGVSELLDRLVIDHLELVYLYEKEDNGAGKSFKFIGEITIGKLQLGVTFVNEKSKWSFTIGLRGKDNGKGKCTIGDILGSMLDELPELPPVIRDVDLGTMEGEELVSFTCSELTTDKTTFLVLVGSIHLKSFAFSFIQYRDRSSPKNTPSKRIIKASISEIGPVEAPLVGKLKQPFDQLFYLWVQDQDGTKKGLKAGITHGEYTALASTDKISVKDRLYFKEMKENTSPVILSSRLAPIL
jgi:hypothetical protein